MKFEPVHLRANIDPPPELKASHRWTNYAAVQRGNKVTKLPLYVDGSPRSGPQGTPADVARLRPFEEALASAQRSQRGIGIAVLPGDGIAVLDFDNCLSDGAPVRGSNRVAYVMASNHDHAFAATLDERRAVPIKVSDKLCRDASFWGAYWAWLKAPGSLAALLHYLQGVDISGFDVREIPRGAALQEQIAITALKDPVAAWWSECLIEGCVVEQGIPLNVDCESVILRDVLSRSFVSFSQRRRSSYGTDWSIAAKKLTAWTSLRTVRIRAGGEPRRHYVFDPLPVLRERFARETGIAVDQPGDDMEADPFGAVDPFTS